MASDRMRIALIGAGRMGRVHLQALSASPRIELFAVVEPFQAAREAVAALGFRVHASIDQLLDGEQPDGVLIAAPSDQHAELVARFAAAGVAVLCEKPVGVRAGDARAASTAAVAGGIPLQVGYWRRFVPELRALREQIAAGEFGDILQISCMQWDAEPPSEAFRLHSGGIAVDMGVHEFDQVRWLLGQEFGSIAATAAGAPVTGLATAADPDCATVLSRLSGGTAAVISLGRQFPHADSCWVEIWGTSGYARIPFMWDAAGEAVFLNAMIAQAESFAAVLAGAPREGAGGEDAVAALIAAERVAESLIAAAAAQSRPEVAAS